MPSPVGLDQERTQEPENNGHHGKAATLFEHLEELRSRIFRSLIYVMLGGALGFWVEPYFYKFLAQPLVAELPKNAQGFYFRNVTDAFFLKFKVSLVLGLVLTMPLIMREVWGFISPALTAREKRSVKLLAPFSAFLFFLGVGLGYYILPAAFKFFISFLDDYNNAALLQDPAQYIMFVVKMMLAFGIGFQMPLVLMFLAKVGLATPEMMQRYWRQAIVGIGIAAAFLTPSGDAFSMLAIGIPMTFLYFLSMVFVSRIAKDRKKKGL